jgi:hypothetical protein
MGKLNAALLALGCCWLTGIAAQEAEREDQAPDLDFLEYLGAWAEEDDEWLAIEEWQKDNAAAPDEGSEESKRADGDEDESE